MYKKGKKNQANKIMHGFGTAIRNENCARRLGEMHPKRMDDGTEDRSKLNKYPLKKDTILKHLKNVNTEQSIDVFEWHNKFYEVIKNKGPGDPDGELLGVHAELIQILGDVEHVPDAVAYVLGAGCITPLNKIPDKQNKALANQGKDQDIRPVNNGVNILKNVGKAALASKAAKKAANKLPNQFSSRSKGMDMVAHIAQAGFEQGKALHKEDARNAFNEIKRSSVIEGAKAKWRSGGGLYRKYYGLRTPVFFNYKDETGKCCCDIIYSEEGVRQGCTLASFGYCLGAEVGLYEHLRHKYTEDTFLFVTDDVNVIVDCPMTDDQEEWEKWYDERADYIFFFSETARDNLNLQRAQKKSTILVPHYAPLPLELTRQNGITLAVTKEGLEMAGTPIGTDEFIFSWLTEKIRKISSKISTLELVAHSEPQIFLSMLTNSLNVSLDYLLRTVSTRRWGSLLDTFDKRVQNSVLFMLNCQESSVERKNRSIIWMSLPRLMGGPALIPVRRKASPAHVTSLMGCVGDIHFDNLKEGLLADALFCHQDILKQCHIDNYSQGHALAAALPVDPTQILSNHFAPETISAFHTKGLNRFFMDYLNTIAKMDLQKSVLGLPHNDCGNTDAVHFLTLTNCSMVSRLFNLDLLNPFFRIDATRFIFMVTFLAGLVPVPPPLSSFIIP